jgi:hypothetical protein
MQHQYEIIIVIPVPDTEIICKTEAKQPKDIKLHHDIQQLVIQNTSRLVLALLCRPAELREL